MKKRILKILKYTIILILIGLIGAFFWIDSELTQMYGGHTTKVDYKQFKTKSVPTVIKNVNVLSSNGSKMLNSQNVYFNEGKIISIDTTSIFPKNALIIDGQGKYLIPGLIDSHVHLLESENDLLLYIANGITYIREMTGTEKHLEWRNAIKNGSRIGPKIFVATGKLNNNSAIVGYISHWTRKEINVSSPNKANIVLQSMKDKGYDAIKLGSDLNKDTYFAISKASEEIGIPIIGHLPIQVSLKDLWNSNQKAIAHIEEIVKALNREFGDYNSKSANEFLKFIKQRSDAVTDSILKNKIAIGSTINLMESLTRQKHDLTNILKETPIIYVNSGQLEGTNITSRGLGWLPKVNTYRLADDYPIENLSGNKIYWNTYAKAIQILLRKMVSKNVLVLSGTDANTPVMVPGFSLHNELKSLTLSGMNNSQALLSATSLPAKWMKVNTGTIEVGYDADLVLLNKNPLDNIENTNTIETVIVRGKVYNRKQLNKMLNAVKEANNKSRTVEIKEFIN